MKNKTISLKSTWKLLRSIKLRKVLNNEVVKSSPTLSKATSPNVVLCLVRVWHLLSVVDEVTKSQRRFDQKVT